MNFYMFRTVLGLGLNHTIDFSGLCGAYLWRFMRRGLGTSAPTTTAAAAATATM